MNRCVQISLEKSINIYYWMLFYSGILVGSLVGNKKHSKIHQNKDEDNKKKNPIFK